MSTIAVTGSAGGMGKAIRRRLESADHRVIGIDLRDAEVVADLSNEAGRAEMVTEVDRLCEGHLDGVVAAAGIQKGEARTIVSTNYFGAIATLCGLRPLLTRGTAPSAVAVSSNSATTQPGYPMPVVELCLADDEKSAKDAIGSDALGAYAASKLALARWVRRRAPSPEWIGAGVRLNAIAPGFIETPMTEGMWDFISSIKEMYPIPIARPGKADEIAGLVDYLLSVDASLLCGSVITIDGGTEAALRPDDWPSPISS
ncbi:MAG TPA: SDR family oxidoreductase [Acidimicrobiales bacterium]|nr:SDR family oxidoreductase [Acidimicrobiales bacterium]